MRNDIPHIINGKRITASHRQLPVYNPALGEVIGSVPVANQDIVNQAVDVAKTAFAAWSQTTPPQRAKILFRYKALLEGEIKNLAKIVTAEHGKTHIEAIGSIQRGMDVLDFVCGMPTHLQGVYSANAATGVDVYSMRQPLGVCAGITPFNFPAMIALWMFPMAIACGNTFILKPSEKNPSCAVRLVELAHEAGVPEGVINLVNGDKETVDAILAHPDVQAVSFVGSSAVASHVYKTAISHHKRAQAFGGAKNHSIVMPDANIKQAAEAITLAAYGSCGERCMAISVVVAVGDTVADQLIPLIEERLRRFKVGPGTDDSVELGPLISQQHLDKVLSYIDAGKREGATVVLDNSRQKPAKHENGFFMGACIFDHVTPSMKIYRDEIFGPVLCVMRVPDIEAAMKLINDHEYGNGTAIFTRDGYTARTFAERVQAGMVGINVPVPVPVASHSFGGWKNSIFADTQMYGAEAIRFYTKLKTVSERWFAEG
jgi:malonate-semialdehyde dehydrogenase (acetylating)/methylmalonate-semialdehyde dehydrogenase